LLDFLHVLDRAKLSSTCKAATNLRMTETEYVRGVRARFVTTTPTFSGASLARYRDMSWLHTVIPDDGSVALWFRGRPSILHSST